MQPQENRKSQTCVTSLNKLKQKLES